MKTVSHGIHLALCKSQGEDDTLCLEVEHGLCHQGVSATVFWKLRYPL